MTDRQLDAWLAHKLPAGPLLDELLAARREVGRQNLTGWGEDGLRYAAWCKVKAARAAGKG